MIAKQEKFQSIILTYCSKKLLAQSVLFLFIKAVVTVFCAKYFGSLIGAVADGNIHDLIRFILLVLVSQIGINGIGIIVTRFRGKVIKAVNSLLKLRTLESVSMKHLRNIDVNHEISFIVSDLKQVDTSGINSELDIADNVIQFMFALIYAMTIDWLTTSVFLLGAMSPLLLAKFFGNRIKKASSHWSRANDNMVASIRKFLGGIDTLRLYGTLSIYRNSVAINVKNLETCWEKMNNLTKMTHELSM